MTFTTPAAELLYNSRKREIDGLDYGELEALKANLMESIFTPGLSESQHEALVQLNVRATARQAELRGNVDDPIQQALMDAQRDAEAMPDASEPRERLKNIESLMDGSRADPPRLEGENIHYVDADPVLLQVDDSKDANDKGDFLYAARVDGEAEDEPEDYDDTVPEDD